MKQEYRLPVPVHDPIFPEDVRPQSQPIAFVDGGEAPVLLLQGEADETVDPGNSTRLAARIREKGGSVEVKTYPGVSHIGTVAALAEILPIRNRDVLPDMVAWLKRDGAA